MPARIAGFAALVIAAVGVCLAASGGTVAFDGGSVTVIWDAGGDGLLITASLSEGAPRTAQETATWVFTAYAGRFEDGIYAWQLHLSPAGSSLLVLPSDFLTARAFTLPQVGIEIRDQVPGQSVSLRIPTLGPIPGLVVPGDLITLHALWVRQTPLVTLTVDPPSTARLDGGGVGGAVSSETEPATRFVPTQTEYRRGEAIEHQFVLPDKNAVRSAGSYSLLRVREGEGDEFVSFSHLDFDEATGIYAYRIATDRLQAGRYRLIVTVQSTGRTEEILLTLRE